MLIQFSEGFKPTLSGRAYDSLKKEPAHNHHLFMSHFDLQKSAHKNLLFMNWTPVAPHVSDSPRKELRKEICEWHYICRVVAYVI